MKPSHFPLGHSPFLHPALLSDPDFTQRFLSGFVLLKVLVFYVDLPKASVFVVLSEGSSKVQRVKGATAVPEISVSSASPCLKCYSSPGRQKSGKGILTCHSSFAVSGVTSALSAPCPFTAVPAAGMGAAQSSAAAQGMNESKSELWKISPVPGVSGAAVNMINYLH